MSERRITHVVGKACCGNNCSDFSKMSLGKFGTFLYYFISNVTSERHSDTSNFKTVCKTVMNENTAGQREYLGLVLHSAKRGRKYQTVIVATELRSVVMTLSMSVFLTKTLVSYKKFPIHHIAHKNNVKIYKTTLFVIQNKPFTILMAIFADKI